MVACMLISDNCVNNANYLHTLNNIYIELLVSFEIHGVLHIFLGFIVHTISR